MHAQQARRLPRLHTCATQYIGNHIILSTSRGLKGYKRGEGREGGEGAGEHHALDQTCCLSSSAQWATASFAAPDPHPGASSICTTSQDWNLESAGPGYAGVWQLCNRFGMGSAHAGTRVWGLGFGIWSSGFGFFLAKQKTVQACWVQ